MADEIINIAVTDDGTTDDVVGLLQLLGLTGEAAAERLESAFVNVSASQQVAEASARAFSAAANAGFTATNALGTALDKLTTSEQKAATTKDNLVRLTQLLATAQSQGIDAAVSLATATDRQVAASDGAAEALGVQAEATTNLSRLQQNLLARQQALAASSTEAATAGRSLIESFTAQYAAMNEAASAATRAATGETAVGTAAAQAAVELSAFTSKAESLIGTFAAIDKATQASADAAYREGEAFAATATAANERAAANDRLAAAELKTVAAQDAAAEAAAAEGRAHTAAGDAAVAQTAKVEELGTATTSFGHSVSGLIPIIAAAFAGDQIIKASDDYQKLAAGLGTVDKTAQQFNTDYAALRDTSNATQTSLSENVNTFVKLRDATDATKISNTQLITAVQGLDTALKLGNVSGQDAYRVQRSISEIFTTSDTSASRYFQNLKRESPAAYALLSQAAQQLGYNLESLNGEVSKQQEAVDKAKAKLQTYSDAHNSASASVGKLQSSITSETSEISKNTAEIDKLQSGTYKTAAAADAANAKILALRQANIQLNTSLGQLNSELATAKSKQQDATDATERGLQANVQAAEAALDNSTEQGKLVEILGQVAKTNGTAAGSFNTVGGALTVLKNNLVDFTKDSATTNITMGALKVAIGLVANNLTTIIPLVIAFGAAMAVLKVVEVAQGIRDLAVATGLLDAAFTPVLVTIGLFTAAVVVAIATIQGLINIFLPAGQQLDTFGTIATTVKSGVNLLTAEVQNLTKGMGASATATGQTTSALNTNNTATTQNTTSTGELTTKVDAATAAHTAYQAAVKKSADASNAMANSDNVLVSSLQKLESFLGGVIAKLAQYAQAAAAAVAAAAGLGGGGGGAAAAPAASAGARDGGTFHVAGGSGVDSKLIAVSPGEVVTVQTPAQYRAGVLPPVRAGQSAFAIGGVTTGAGVDLGTGVQLSTDALTAADGSVTGFQQASDPTTAANDNTQATSDNTTATANDTSATAANTGSVAAATAATIQLVSVSNSNAQLATDSAKTIAGASAGSASASNDNTAAVRSLSQNVVNAANAIVSAANTLSSTVAAAANAIASAASSIGSAGSASSSSSSSTDTSDTSSGASTSTGKTYGTTTSADGKYTLTDMGNNTSGYTKGGELYSLSDSSGNSLGTFASTPQLPGQTSVTPPGSGLPSLYYLIGGTSVSGSVTAASQKTTPLDPQANQTVSGASSVYNTSAQQYGTTTFGNDTSTDDSYDGSDGGVADDGARDGGDFYVPGSSGVDSRLLRLAVSPGESVHIRTPAQQNVGGGNTNHYTVNMPVTAADAQSFGRSSRQFEQQFARGLKRVARK